MATHMRLKMRILNKVFGTMRTLVWPFTCMRAQMNLQVVAPEEHAWAVWTLQMTLIGMAAIVGMKI